MEMRYSIGIDLGTSNITALLLSAKGNVVDCVSERNESQVNSRVFESLQNPEKIWELAQLCIDTIINRNKEKNICGIGIANQMHGIVYIDKKGNSTSMFINWQDKRGDYQYKDNLSYVSYIKEHTGYSVPSGYGLTSHYYNYKNNLVHQNTRIIIDIGTFIVSKLIKKYCDVIHASNAQAWGFFKIEENDFDRESLKKLDIDINILPTVSNHQKPLGVYKNIPVYESIGDNQAGMLGSIGIDYKSVLINIGTSAQISFLCNKSIHDFEERPFFGTHKLLVASSLCGGKALSIWVSFLVNTVKTILPDINEVEIKNHFFSLISKINKTDSVVKVNPYFLGTRNKNLKYASIENLEENNFNLEEISVAMILGIIDELLAFWNSVPQAVQKEKKYLYITGGATKLNSVISCITKKFHNLEIKCISNQEDAAIGAAKKVFLGETNHETKFNKFNNR